MSTSEDDDGVDDEEEEETNVLFGFMSLLHGLERISTVKWHSSPHTLQIAFSWMMFSHHGNKATIFGLTKKKKTHHGMKKKKIVYKPHLLCFGCVQSRRHNDFALT